MIARLAVLLAASSMAGASLLAADGDVLATSAEAKTFRMWVNGSSTFAMTSSADVAAWPVTWRAGEAVAATAMDGTGYVLSNGEGGASSASIPSHGGVWTLSKSRSGAAVVGVSWPVFDDGGTLASAASSAYAVDMMQDGPDRRGRADQFPPVAYSGDNWLGDAAKAATLTFTPPANSGLSTTTLDLAGTGVQSFAVAKPGVWTVLLEMDDGTTREALVNAFGGFVISFR